MNIEALLIEAFTKGRDYQRTVDEHGIKEPTSKAADEWKQWREEKLEELKREMF